MKRGKLVGRALAALLVASCGSTHVAAEAGADSGDAVANCPNPVYGVCSTEGARGCGRPSVRCSDMVSDGPPHVGCTCHAGIWDCRKCQDCSWDMRQGPPAMNCLGCEGGSVTRCDGTKTKVISCFWSCEIGNGPPSGCTDTFGQKFGIGCPIPQDAGTD